MAENVLFPVRSYLMEVSEKKLNLSDYYAEIAPRMGGKLLAFRESILEGRTDHWLEYVPDAYNKAQTAVPLVISVHGGGQKDYCQFYETSWYRIAERTGAIIVCPQMPQDGMAVFTAGSSPNEDMLFIDTLIELMKGKYTIDSGRIFIQGMSMGALISTQYGRIFGHKLAGIGMTSGPTAPSKLFDGEKLLYNDGPVAVWQSRGTFDTLVTEPGHLRTDINTANRRFWMELNGCTEFPRLKLAFNENWVYYTGEKAPLVYKDNSNSGHNQSVDDAECAWDSLFSRVRRDENGKITILEDIPEGDRNAVVLLSGSSFAYVDNKKIQMTASVFIETDYSMPFVPRPGSGETAPEPDLEAVVMETYTYVPVSFLETAFGARVRSDSRTAYVTAADGRQLCFAEKNLGAMMEGRVYDMGREAKTVDGVLFIPVEWYARWVEGKYVSKKDSVVYIGPCPGTLTNDMVNIIKEILS
jgi:poly(3-hydroxybutyrate) depolymerase